MAVLPLADYPAPEQRVGPHGYIHGWIFVGIPGAGDVVTHPHFGAGRITTVGGGRVGIKFAGGTSHSFEHEPAPGAPSFKSRSTAKAVTGRGALAAVTTVDYDKNGDYSNPGIDAYTTGQFRDINGMLRGRRRTSKKIDACIAAMDREFKDAKPLDRPIKVYRGGHRNLFGGEGDMTGAEVTDSGFLSTSANEGKGSRFGSADPHSVVFEIRVPPGVRALGLAKPSEYGRDEDEILLARGTRFRVVSDSGYPHRRMVLEVIP